MTLRPGPTARVYVCGITPYDATHLGHAATYVTFDILNRTLLDAGHEVRYAQNITDIDDPLLERADRDGIDWRDLATMEIQLFRDDMSALRVLPPRYYTGVVESMELIGEAVARLIARGVTYELPVGTAAGDAPPPLDAAVSPEECDIYLDLATQPEFGTTSGWTREQMAEVFADRGGDPDRPGKRDPLDPLLWRAVRPGEPAWTPAGLHPGRPGWHVECTAIALAHLGAGFDVQGGGTDLIFPHHEMSAVQAVALLDPPHQPVTEAFATAYQHQAMVGLHGEKMSKSKGNLVLVSTLREEGVDPMAIRLVLLAHHYRTPWDWTDDVLDGAFDRLARWRRAVATRPGGRPEAPERAARLLGEIRAALADDLDTPAALQAVDRWCDWAERGGDAGTAGDAPAPATTPTGDKLRSDAVVLDAIDALLGIRLD